MTKVSIIIPVYNSEKYLQNCLESIKNQTEKDFEVIIINDGSTDNSKLIIADYLKDKRFKLIDQKNQGIGYSRNKGIEESKGQYVVFIDSDDSIEKNFLEEMLKKIEKDNLDIVVCDYIEENEETKEYNETLIPPFENTTIKENKELLLSINKAPWNKIYKKELIKDIRFPEDLKYEDTQFICEALKNAKIGKINQCLNHYVIHSKSETTTMNIRVFDIIKIIDNTRYIYRNEKDLQETIDKLTLQILTTYTIQQRYQSDKNIRNKFINDVFKYLEKNVPNYKNNIYFKERGLKGMVEKNIHLTKIYCNLYKLK